MSSEDVSGEGMPSTSECAWRALLEARVTRRQRRAEKRAARDRVLATLLAFCVWGCGSSDPFKGCSNLGCNNSGCNNSGCNNSGCNNSGCNDNGCNSGTTTPGPVIPTGGTGPKPIKPARPAGAPSGTTPDEFEPNETEAQSAVLDEESDEMTDSAYFLSLHTPTDVDFFKVHVVDQGIDGNPSITIAVDTDDAISNIPAIAVSYTCDSGQPLDTDFGSRVVVSCDDDTDTCGTDATGYALTFTPQCQTNDDSVEVFLELASLSGQPVTYSLQFYVD